MDKEQCRECLGEDYSCPVRQAVDASRTFGCACGEDAAEEVAAYLVDRRGCAMKSALIEQGIIRGEPLNPELPPLPPGGLKDYWKVRLGMTEEKHGSD
ncbi:hypothetical protein M0R72_06500 [Candidatus Pacearchaeota archaeon]|jgi:hypothetical protein|nr:hypothetical protein [Candidatus Pacearchaeota archaeon]